MGAGREVAYLFAGQGAHYVGMGEAARAAGFGAAVDEALALLDRALGAEVSALVARGPLEALTLTENAQPAILALGWAHVQIARELGLSPQVAAGHSLGEYGAWVVAGSLEIEDALRVVRRRGQAMQAAVPVGEGAMSAVISAPTEAVEALCAEVSARRGEVCQVGVYNCPGNVVVSGQVGAVEAVEAEVAAQGMGMTRRLEVSAPFHTSLLQPAAAALEEALAAVEVRPNALPVLSNVTGQVVEAGASPEVIRGLLVEQVVAPVRWEACLRGMLAREVSAAALLGPGTMTRGQVKRIARRFETLALDEAAELAALRAAKEQG